MTDIPTQKKIFLNSFIITCAIFILGMFVSYGMDFLRIDQLDLIMKGHELNTQGYYLEKDFTDHFGGDRCQVMHSRLADLKINIHQLGADLTNYGTKSLFKKKDFDYLKRKYFLEELKFLSLINQLNERCYTSFVPILFFYEIDDSLSERVGYVLEDFGQIEEYRDNVVVLNLDKDYEDERLVQSLVERFKITEAPTIIINNELKMTGNVFTGELNRSVARIFNPVDEFARMHDVNFTLDATGTNKTKFLARTRDLLEENISRFAKADIKYVIGRITGNDSLICEALFDYDAAHRGNPEESALIYESIVSIGCGRNRRAFLKEAANAWEEAGNEWRADIDRSLANGKDIGWQFEGYELPNISINASGDSYVIGLYNITLTDNDTIVSQTDRVLRDWLSYQLFHSPYYAPESADLITEYELDREKLLTTFSERLTYNDSELLPETGWHEGARLKQIREAISPEHIIASNTLVKRFDGKWYAANEEGVFMFEVPKDKVLYPTTKFLKEDIAVIEDTHGINMLVDQAVRNNASVVVGCCDHPGKIAAAHYLGKRGIQTVCFTDKYLPLLLGSDTPAIGSPPIEFYNDSVVLGDRPMTIPLDEPIVSMDVASDRFALSYYKTPKIYFTTLEDHVDLNVTYVSVTDFGQMQRVADKARDLDVDLIAARVFSSDDYEVLKAWLDEDENNRLMLFHTVSYPYGYRILHEYPGRTTFDDIRIMFR